MDSTRRKLAAVLAGGVLLASVAYGIGTQTGGGGASAVGSPDSSSPSQARRDHHGHSGLSAFAKKLGVDESELTAALREIRSEMKPPHREFAADLASALGVSKEKVTKALESRRSRMDGRHQRSFAAALAKELGVEASKVRSVFRGPRHGRRHGHASRVEVAKRLGVTRAELRAALERIRPDRRQGRPPRRMAGRLAPDLAQALGLDVDDVKAALKKLRSRHRGEHASRRNAFAKALAEKLEIPVQKVLKALPRRGAHGAHRRGGPGGGPPRAFDGPGFGPGGPAGG